MCERRRLRVPASTPRCCRARATLIRSAAPSSRHRRRVGSASPPSERSSSSIAVFEKVEVECEVGWQTERKPAEKIEIEHGDGAVPIGKAPAHVLVLVLLWQLPPTHCGGRAPRLEQRALHRAERAEKDRRGHILVRRNDVASFILVVKELKNSVIAEKIAPSRGAENPTSIIDKPSCLLSSTLTPLCRGVARLNELTHMLCLPPPLCRVGGRLAEVCLPPPYVGRAVALLDFACLPPYVGWVVARALKRAARSRR